MFQLLLLCVLQSCRFGCCCIKCQLAVNAFGMINISANIVAEAVLYNVHADAAENVTVNLVSVDADGCVVCMQVLYVLFTVLVLQRQLLMLCMQKLRFLLTYAFAVVT